MGKYKQLIGKRFGKLTVKDYVGNSKWSCKCDCGGTKVTDTRNLTTGDTKSCGCLSAKRYDDLSGKRFGKLIVSKYIGKLFWECICDCGNIKNISAAHLKRGDTKSCGCITKYDDLSGKRFGKLTAEKYIGDRYWLCRCDCGGTKEVCSSHLKSGSVKNCGCEKVKRYDDLSGKRFGKLTAEKYVGLRNWRCKCDCGNTILAKSNNLKAGRVKSCGCLRERYSDMVGKTIGKLTLLEYKGDGKWRCSCSHCGKKNIYLEEDVDMINDSNSSCDSHPEYGLNKKHGFWNTNYSEGKMKFYKMWQGMKARCSNPNLKDYKNYGGRGITYDIKWENFLEFKKDMYLKYLYANKHLKMINPSIERVDVNGNYCKENCCFIELKNQLKNTRNVREFIATSPEGINTKEKNVAEFSDKHGLNSSHIYECLDGKAEQHKGWRFKALRKVTVKRGMIINHNN